MIDPDKLIILFFAIYEYGEVSTKYIGIFTSEAEVKEYCENNSIYVPYLLLWEDEVTTRTFDEEENGFYYMSKVTLNAEDDPPF